jgi:hypothetical protein
MFELGSARMGWIVGKRAKQQKSGKSLARKPQTQNNIWPAVLHVWYCAQLGCKHFF